MNRYLYPFILNDLQRKMAFIGGPRQVGKTTLSKAIASENYQHWQYLNWDSADDKRAIVKKHWNTSDQLIILDELHKYTQWKNWLKGLYDTKPANQQYLVTGSARLDVYKRGGDSLLGRYHYWRLHPLTLDELPEGISSEEGYKRLLKLGGFPEPFLLNDEREARRWRRERFERIVREDIRDLENVHHLQLLDVLIHALQNRVGGLVILSNLAEDLGVASKTVKNWLQIIEKMYIAFSIYPLTHNVPRSILKPAKVYFYDNADVEKDESATLENLVATHLLKRLHFIEDYYGHRCELRYIRDKDGREVNFVTVIDSKVEHLIEVKTNDTNISSSLKYYANKLKPKRAIQLVGNLNRSFDKDNIEVLHPIQYFKEPPWVL